MTSTPPTQQPLPLHPFPGEVAPADLRLVAWAGWRPADGGAGLALRWRLEGDLAALDLPATAASVERRDGLWQSSCFEAFLARRGDVAYRELNLSPAGHWNLYRLEGYRLGLRPDAAMVHLPSRRRQGPDWLELALELPAALLPAGPGELQLAITAVLATKDGRGSHWALAHAGDAPDFHRRESFVHSL